MAMINVKGTHQLAHDEADERYRRMKWDSPDTRFPHEIELNLLRCKFEAAEAEKYSAVTIALHKRNELISFYHHSMMAAARDGNAEETLLWYCKSQMFSYRDRSNYPFCTETELETAAESFYQEIVTEKVPDGEYFVKFQYADIIPSQIASEWVGSFKGFGLVVVESAWGYSTLTKTSHPVFARLVSAGAGYVKASRTKKGQPIDLYVIDLG